MRRQRGAVTVFPTIQEFERAEIPVRDLRLMIRNLELTIQAAQNTINLASRNLEGVKHYIETRPVPPPQFHQIGAGAPIETACRYIAMAATLVLLYLGMASAPVVDAKCVRTHARVARHHNS